MKFIRKATGQLKREITTRGKSTATLIWHVICALKSLNSWCLSAYPVAVCLYARSAILKNGTQTLPSIVKSTTASSGSMTTRPKYSNNDLDVYINYDCYFIPFCNFWLLIHGPTDKEKPFNTLNIPPQADSKGQTRSIARACTLRTVNRQGGTYKTWELWQHLLYRPYVLRYTIARS